MSATTQLFKTSPRRHLRPFDVSQDLNAVADLIERCFADTMDPDGQRYLRQMRSAARNPRFLRWAASVAEHVSLPLSGYVWEEEGEIVGNLSLIPLTAQGNRVYLIANVAVEPEYRRRGIARALTVASLDLARRRKTVRSVWLQVRAENDMALNLYQSLNFVERAQRTAWHRRQDYWPPETVVGVKIRPRQAQHWSQQRSWLERLYPPTVSWNLPFNLTALRPGLFGALYRLFSGAPVKQWVALRDRQLLGALAWRPSAAFADQLWLAAPRDGEDLAVRALLGHIQPAFPRHRQLSLDFPAGRAVQAFDSVGFFPYQTLIWMELKL